MSSPFTFIRESDTGGSVKRVGKQSRKLLMCLEDPRLGTMGSVKLAKSLGVSRSTVRRAKSIKFGSAANCSEQLLMKLRKIPDLGQKTDAEIAEREGVKQHLIAKARKANGLMSLQEKKRRQRREDPNELVQYFNNWPRSPEVARYVEGLRQ